MQLKRLYTKEPSVPFPVTNDKFEDNWELLPDENGQASPVFTGRVNVYEKIQAAGALAFDLRELADSLPGDTIGEKLTSMASQGLIHPVDASGTVLDTADLPTSKAETVLLMKKAQADGKANGLDGDLSAMVKSLVEKEISKLAEANKVNETQEVSEK